MNRRNALKLLGSLPVIGPKLAPGLAAKLASEQKAAVQSGVGISGFASDTPPSIGPNASTRYQLAMQLPWFRDELRSLLLEQNRKVGRLDPDLAVLKSVSLSAKIYYQRQRNVEAGMKEYTTEPVWSRVNSLFSKVCGLIPTLGGLK